MWVSGSEKHQKEIEAGREEESVRGTEWGREIEIERDGQVWFVYLFGLFMSWPEQRVSPPIYNISKRVMWRRCSSFSLAKLHRQTFHRVREALCSEISPSIFTRTHYRFSFTLCHRLLSSPSPPRHGENVSYRIDAIVNITLRRRTPTTRPSNRTPPPPPPPRRWVRYVSFSSSWEGAEGRRSAYECVYDQL